MMKPHKLLAPIALPLALLTPAAAPAQPAPTPKPAATAAPSASSTAAPAATTAPAATAAPSGTAEPAGSAEPTPELDEARAHFQRGVELFRESNFRAALVELTRSFDVSHNYKVLYNIGQTQYELQDYAAALRTFERYLRLGGDEIEAARRAQVESDIKGLGTRVARLEIKSNATDAEVFIDDVSVGKTPLAEPQVVSIGRRKIVIQKNGVATPARTVDLAGGDRTSVTIDLNEVKVTEADTTPSRTGVWVSLAITGGLVAGTAIVGGLALSAHDDQEKKLGTFGAKKADIEAARSKTQTLALVADILGGTAIAMAGVTIILAATSGKSSAPPAPKAAITVGPRGLAVSGSF